jgi:hypothetical protein
LCSPNKYGGLGIRSLKEFNDSLLLKWAIKLFEDDDRNWSLIIKDAHGSSHVTRCIVAPCRPSPFWKSVWVAMRDNWHDFELVLGDGQ